MGHTAEADNTGGESRAVSCITNAPVSARSVCYTEALPRVLRLLQLIEDRHRVVGGQDHSSVPCRMRTATLK
jgi:hypothetical protein